MVGYAFVPIPDKPYRSSGRPEQMTLDRRLPDHWFGAVELVLQADQPLHIGSGFKRVADGDRAVRAAVRSGVRLAVPGSSFKGLVRARFEAMTASCAHWAPKRGSLVSQSRPDIRYGHVSDDAKRHELFTPCSEAEVCPACALFGFQAKKDAMQGRVAFEDFLAAEGTEPELATVDVQWGPRLHHLGPARVSTNHRGEPSFELTGFHGRKFAVGPSARDPEATQQTVEVIPVGTELWGRVRLFNVTDAEFGGLLAAVGVQPKGALKLGGMKAQGCGRVSVRGVFCGLRDHLRRPRDFDLMSVWAAYEQSDWRCAEAERALFELHRGAKV